MTEKLKQIENDLRSREVEYKIIPIGFNAKIIVDENGQVYN